MTGAIKPDAGKIFFGDKDITTLTEDEKKNQTPVRDVFSVGRPHRFDDG